MTPAQVPQGGHGARIILPQLNETCDEVFQVGFYLGGLVFILNP
jgi:hypothetical protein